MSKSVSLVIGLFLLPYKQCILEPYYQNYTAIHILLPLTTFLIKTCLLSYHKQYYDMLFIIVEIR